MTHPRRLEIGTRGLRRKSRESLITFSNMESSTGYDILVPLLQEMPNTLKVNCARTLNDVYEHDVYPLVTVRTNYPL